MLAFSWSMHFQQTLLYAQSGDIELNMSDPSLWTVDVIHLGSRTVQIFPLIPTKMPCNAAGMVP